MYVEIKLTLFFAWLIVAGAMQNEEDDNAYIPKYFSEGLYTIMHDGWDAVSGVLGLSETAESETEDSAYIPKDIAETLEIAFIEGGAAAVKMLLSDKLDDWKKSSINVGVTGASGVGKSSFINALRGLTADDDGAAAVGVVETTKEYKSYKHPNNTNLLLWDLPGVGTPTFLRDEYLDKIKFQYYDYFIIMSAGRFTENDKWLARELKMKQKKFFFVRSKIDFDVANNIKSHPMSHNQTNVLDDIRKDCKKNLQGYAKDVYLIDNYETDKYDFNFLSFKLVEDAPELKKEAMLLTLNRFHEDLILAKKNASTDRIPIVALASGIAGAIPIPGLDIIVDLGAVVEEASFYQRQFGLTDEALAKLAAKAGKSVDEFLKSLKIESKMIALSLKGIAAYMTKLGAKKMARYTSKKILKYVLPGIGSIIGAAASYTNCYNTLESLLEMNANDALKIARFVRDTNV